MSHPEPCWKETAPTRAEEISISCKAQWQAIPVASLGKLGPPLHLWPESVPRLLLPPSEKGIHIKVTRLFIGPEASLATPQCVGGLWIDGIVPNAS